MPEYDIDYKDYGNPKEHSVPHKHTWDGLKRSKPINID